MILNKKKDFLDIFIFLYPVDTNNSREEYKIFYYPINFNFINKDIYSKLKNINIKIEQSKKEEIELGINNGKVLITPKKDTFDNFNGRYICNFFYILKEENNGDYNYIFDKINFYDNVNNRDNEFYKYVYGKELIKKYSSIDDLMLDKSTNSCTCISNDDINNKKELTNSKTISDINDINLNKYIDY